LFCSIRHPLIMAPIAAQRQALLTEKLWGASTVILPSTLL
jgi:hypothetical protein